MNRQIRVLGVALLACFVVLFVQLNLLQVAAGTKYKNDPRNTLEVVTSFSKPRGQILSADGHVLAESVKTTDKYDWQRQYPYGELFGHPVGFYSFKYGTDGVERVQNDVLTGSTGQQQLRGLGNIFNDRTTVGDVTTTLRVDIQQAAKDALGDREGSVVVLDPRTGAVLALWSYPSIDPNLLASHDLKIADDARALYLLDDRKPLLANTYQERYMPGSTFKVVTTTAALETGTVTVDTPFAVESEFIPPLTTVPIKNYGGSSCGGTFAEVFKKSCNTPFARLGVLLGADQMIKTVGAFGLQEPVPIDLPSPVASFFGTPKDFVRDDPRLAQSSFGQNAVQLTPLHMALIASAVANGGTIMTPYVVAETHDADGALLTKHTPKPWRTAMNPTTAATLTQLMIGVANEGTARCCLKLAGGIQAAAKTGTAQLTVPPEAPLSHAWIMAFAPAEAPRIVVAVMVKATPEVTAGTGGTVAGPVARQVLDAALAATADAVPPSQHG